MQSVILENTKNAVVNKKIIEKRAGVKISFSGKRAVIEGDELKAYLAAEMLKAIAAGFEIDDVLLLLDEDYLLEVLPIKNVTKRKNLKEVRARVIGQEGRALRNFQNLTDCRMVLHGNIVYIIGRAEDISTASDSITSLIQGVKHSSVYSILEKKHAKKTEIEDLGLKDKF